MGWRRRRRWGLGGPTGAPERDFHPHFAGCGAVLEVSGGEWEAWEAWEAWDGWDGWDGWEAWDGWESQAMVPGLVGPVGDLFRDQFRLCRSC